MAGTIVQDPPRNPVVPPDLPPRSTRPPEARPSPWDRRSGLLLALTIVLTVLAWLPFLHHPLEQDEGGFLLLGRQWTHGTSLYGDYWVDRPPLLLWLFSAVGSVGHVSHGMAGAAFAPLKIAGAATAGLTVLLGAIMASLVAPTARRRRTAVTVLAAALVCSPLLGMPEVDGEMLAVPFVLLGACGLLVVWRHPGARCAGVTAALAGVAATCAFLVKQSAVDVFVLAGVALLVRPLRSRTRWVQVLAFALGALGALGVALVASSARGTTPRGLWQAVVLFRLQASAVLGSSASPSTLARMEHLGLGFVVSGAAALVVLAGWRVLTARRRLVSTIHRGDTLPGLAVPALAMTAWEVFVVAAGGSYWSHYLTVLVPGVLLLLSLDAVWQGGRTRLVAAFLAYAVAVNIGVWSAEAVQPEHVSTDAQVEAYLRTHASPSDGVVVGFGHPDIVEGSGLHSPYSMLWSLPVRVRDPGLHTLDHVLTGRSAPRWLVVAGDSLSTWGVDAGPLQGYVDRHYVDKKEFGDWHVWERS